MTEITVPAERWEEYAKSNSCINGVEQKGGCPVSVKTFAHNGFFFTSFGVMYGAYASTVKPSIWAYKLLPLHMYQGETTQNYHDEATIAAGLRERGDCTGLIVSVKGKRMVCAEKITFTLGLPSSPPISHAEAVNFNATLEQAGWRALFFNDANIAWYSLSGHPVVVYTSPSGKSATTLFYRSASKKILEMRLDEAVALDHLSAATQEVLTGSFCLEPDAQLVLF